MNSDGPFAATALLVMVLLAAGLLLGTQFLALPWSVRGASMEPALSEGDRVIVDLWTYRHRRPRIGEIVLVSARSGRMLVKRVGMPRAGSPERSDETWIYGDNADASEDSRQFGAVGTRSIRGRVVSRIWPPGKIGVVR